jgi:hypothetical protein
MPINKNELTKEMIEKAMQCKTSDELMTLANTDIIIVDPVLMHSR